MLLQYEPYLRKIVYELRSRGGLPGVDDLEDLMQEARVEFLVHLRKIPDQTDILKCRYNIIGALCTYWRSMAQIRIPKNVYHKVIREVQCVSLDGECRENLEGGENPSEEAEVLDFLSSLTPEERVIIRMKLAGYKSREIMPVLHVSREPQMSRMLGRVRNKARTYFAS